VFFKKYICCLYSQISILFNKKVMISDTFFTKVTQIVDSVVLKKRKKDKTMELHNLMFLIPIPIIMLALYLVSVNLLIISIIGSFIAIAIIFYTVRNQSRKETLNIVRSGKTFHFTLNDDKLFSVELKDDVELSDLLHHIIERERGTFKGMVEHINFVNFQNDALQKQLNDCLKQ